VKNKIIISSEELRSRAFEVISAIPLTPPHEVIVREHKKDRSICQNSLLWKWYTIIAAELGESKEDVHERYKDKYLVNIYERDNPEYAEMVQSLRVVYQKGMKQEALSLRKRIVALTSTTTATVAQMSEYMTNVDRDAASLAINLPHPEDVI
jgi:hypothetical protein